MVKRFKKLYLLGLSSSLSLLRFLRLVNFLAELPIFSVEDLEDGEGVDEDEESWRLLRAFVDSIVGFVSLSAGAGVPKIALSLMNLLKHKKSSCRCFYPKKDCRTSFVPAWPPGSSLLG